jgi:hypothetical protein
MSKARAKVFPKPPERLNSTSAKLLGKNSNKACYEASVKGIYNTEPKIKDSLTYEQKRMLANLRKNLSSTYQPE